VAKNTSGLKPPWPKGVSGNPGGRPRKQPMTDDAKRALEDPVSDTLRAELLKHGIELPEGATMRMAIAKGAVRRAIIDNATYTQLQAMIEGKPTARVELSGPDGGALESIVYSDLTDEQLAERRAKMQQVVDAVASPEAAESEPPAQAEPTNETLVQMMDPEIAVMLEDQVLEPFPLPQTSDISLSGEKPKQEEAPNSTDADG
jgi:hypothetical protein